MPSHMIVYAVDDCIASLYRWGMNGGFKIGFLISPVDAVVGLGKKRGPNSQ